MSTQIPLEIDVKQLDKMRKDGADHLLLDVRQPEELAIASLDGITHIPMNDIPARVQELPDDKPIVVMCHLGGRSGQVTAWLRSQGFENATNLSGGITAWSHIIDKSIPVY